ncbi:ATP-binding protein [Streptomyces nitrosporeus]|uniref:ATP-binding protein n=1 Tax=Streptomyces nitrosporeus TaxID=28894 RepID=A0A5J6F793_9ACTN|nr:ATP-binding protein [Streptomyces nitrosporeus]QEU71717.1 ATP-binding protein [Streptomyces nitrosporeus]GGY94861.1 ATP-binding protein [Streptomyces nitrosporeus]
MNSPHTPRAPHPSVFSQRFSSTRRGARLARLLSALQLADWGLPRGTGAHDAVVQVVGELAANAVTHGRVPGRDFALVLAYEAARGVIRVEVSDTHPGVPARRAAGGVEEGGRGLLVVAALSFAWGVSRRVGPGKTVWAECGTTGGEGGPDAGGHPSGAGARVPDRVGG